MDRGPRARRTGPSPLREGAFERFLDCGILAKGFVRVRCPECGYDTAVGFSCKERGLCPSCTGRRMDEVAANLVDRVFPRVPVRQWVLSMPHAVRFYLAKDATLLTGVLRIFVDEIFRDYRRRARPSRMRDALCGGVTAVQRFGGALNLNVHFHSLLLDGVYIRDEFTGGLRFQRLPDPSTENVERLAWILKAKILKYLAKKGCLVAGEAASEAAAEQDPTLLDAVQAASVREWVALGERPHRVATSGRREEWALPPEKPLCGRAEGFNLHAAVEIGGGDRKGLENLCRYILRPPFSAERLERLPDGRIAYGFRKPRPDGSTHVILEPMELMEKLAALVPPPRAHLVRYHGVLAPRGGGAEAGGTEAAGPGAGGGAGLRT
ncbi:MAG TPA: transposase [Planctomycetota bacterium]|nr:transposase [Planctomycetota bacterium]